MDTIKEKKKRNRKAYVLLAVFAVFAIAFVSLAASGTLTNWVAKYEAKKNYEAIIASVSDVKDENTLRQLLILDEELDITVTEDIEVKTGFTVNGTKTLHGDATISADLGIFKVTTLLKVTPETKLTMDGLVLDGNAIANGITVEQGGELTYESGEITYAAVHGITTSGLTTIEDVTISRSATSAIDAAFGSEVYLKGGNLVDNANIAIYVEANAYMQITGNPVIDGTSHNAIRNRGKLEVFGGTFSNIGNYVIANHKDLLVEYKGSDDGYIEMKDIRQGVLYNNNTASSVLRDIHASNMTLDGVKAAGGTVLVENCVFDTMSGNGIYMSAGEVTVKNTAFSNTGKCATYSLGGCKLNLEDVTFENIGTRGIMNKGGNVTGTNVTIKNVERFAVSNEKSGAGVVGTVDLINPHILECNLTNIYNTSEGTKLTITGGVLEESPRTNVYVTNGEVILDGVEILGTAAKDKAAISIGEKGVVTLSGKSKIHGNGIRGVNISGVFNMKGGEIYGYNADTASGGAVRLFTKGTFNMSGGALRDNKTSYGGGAVYMGKNSVFNMKGGKIHNNTAQNNGGAVQVEIGGTFNMSGGTISNNQTQKASAGAVYVYGKMKMSGGTITGNKSATYGGAINLNKKADSKTKEMVYGEFVMTGGSITGNSSVKNGGAVNISSDTTFTMSGGSIADNTSKGKGSGVNQNGTFIVSGSASIKNNVVTLGGTSKVVTIKGDTLSAHNAKEPFQIEPSFGAVKGTVLAKCESADIASKVLGSLASGSKSYTSLGQLAETIVIGSYKETADMDMTGADTVYVSNYQELKEAVESTTSKRNVIICASIEMEGVITVPDGCTVAIKDDGTTRVLSRADKNVGTFFRTNYGTGLSIAATEKGKLVFDGEISKNADASKVKQLLVVRGTTEVANITLKDNLASGETGALIRQHYGDMTVTGCTLSGAYGNTGGAIAVGTGTATIQSSTFNGNDAKYNGGAIRVEKNATVTVDSCEFKENTANSVGGAINSDVGTLIVKNSVFEGNISKGTSGAINLTNNSTANITDSTFKGNSSTEDSAGAIKVNKSALVLEDSIFEENTTTQSGGAIFLQGKIDENTYSYVTATGCTFKANSAGKTGGAIKGETGVVITLNDSEFIENVIVGEGTTGGAIDAYKSTVNATDVIFEKNTSNTYGGAVYLNTGAVANLEGCQFSENVGGTLGGAIYLQKTATAVVDDCNFTSNSSGKYEGGAIANKGNLTVSNSIFEANVAKTHGGAIYAAEESTLNTVIGCTFGGNNAVYNGGAVYVNTSAKATLEDCAFEANYTDKWSGGAVYNRGNLTATACSFTENKAGSLEGTAAVTNHGGAIDAYSNDTFLDNCTFSANEGVIGADIYIRNEKTITINGGTFTDSVVGYQTGSKVGKAVLSGSFVGNVTFKYEYADKAGVVIGAAGISGTGVYITPSAYIEGHELITKTDDASEGTLKAAANLIQITNNDDELEWVVESDGTMKPLGTLQVNIAQNASTGVKYTSIQAAVNAAQNGETIYILYDRELKEATTISEGKNVTITNAPGKKVTLFRTFEGTLFTVEKGSTLTLGSDVTEEIKDSVGTLTVDGGYDETSTDSIIAKSLVNNAGTINLKANTTLQYANAGTSNREDCYGGALYNTGTANLAGNFIGNRGYNGGAIYNATGTLNITTGVYSQNLASNKGGVVFVAKNTEKATIANAEMTGNDVTNKDSQGVAIYLDGGDVANELTLEGCNIHENTVDYKDDKDCGSDVLLGDNTTLNLKDNISLGVIHQRYGYAQPSNSGNSWPYAVINVKEKYTGEIIIVPNGGNFTNETKGVGRAQIVNFDADMSAADIATSTENIVVRKVENGVPNDDTYCVDKNGILQYKNVKIGDKIYNTLQDAVNAVESGKSETTVIEVLHSKVLSETVEIKDSKDITITNVAGSNITLTRAFEGTLFTVDETSKLTLGSTDTANKFIIDGGSVADAATEVEVPTLINNANEFVLQKNAALQNADAGEDVNGGALYTTGTAKIYGTVKDNSAENGGAIYVEAGSLEAEGAIFSGNEGSGNGGAINSNYGATVILDACAFYRNKSVNSGGAVYSRYKLETKNNCIFEENEVTKSGSSSGGAICVYDGDNNNAITIISNTQFTKNISKNRSSAIDINGGEDKDKGAFTIISDCTFSQNDANGTDSTIQLRVTGYVELSDCTFSGTLDGGQDIIYFYDKNSAKPTMGIEGVISNVQFKNVWADQIIVNGTIDESSITVAPKTYTEGTLLLKEGAGAEAGQLESATSIINVAADANGNEWFIGHDGKLVKATTVAQVGSTYYTDVNSAINAAIESEDTQATVYVYNSDELDMAEAISIASGKTLIITNVLGKEVTLTRKNTNQLFSVAEGASLTIGSATAGGSIIVDGAYDKDEKNYQKASLVNNAGTFTLEANATIQNAVSEGSATYVGGALNNVSGATATIYGKIQYCSAYNGGAIYNEGTVNIENSAFLTYNTANEGNGGAIRNKGTLTITGATFSNNGASGAYGNGGAIYSTATLEIDGTTFRKNTAETTSTSKNRGCGGAIWIEDKNEIATITNATFEENSAGNGGGAILMNRSAAISNTTMTKNKVLANAKYNGSAIYIRENYELTLRNCNIYDNEFVYNSEGNPGCDISLGSYDYTSETTAKIKLYNNISVGIVHFSNNNNVGSIEIMKSSDYEGEYSNYVGKLALRPYYDSGSRTYGKVLISSDFDAIEGARDAIAGSITAHENITAAAVYDKHSVSIAADGTITVGNKITE
ncbi:MAG: right-handed parallel beta-helix repeat-containing protein [Tyzzerella sp.]|nr:right-handed parallel beta-helix repeat-containing protein [Tyzzerella sp.]